MRNSRPVFPLVVLLVITTFVIWPLLKIGYTSNMGSLEPATLVMAKRVAEDGIWGWYQNWYLGFPFRFAGPPLTWWLLGFLKWANIADVLNSYRLLFFASLVLFPISFYFLARKIFESANDSLDATKKRSADLKISATSLSLPRSSLRPASAIGKTRSLLQAGLRHVFGWRQSYHQSLPAFISTFVLIFLPSVGYFFGKYFLVGSQFGFAPSWLISASLARSAALVLFPIVILAFWRLLEEINYRNLIICIFSAAILFLVDGVTPFSLLIALAVLLVIEGHKGKFFEKLVSVGLALILAFLVDAFFFTPANIKVIATSPSISGIGLISFLKTIFQAGLGIAPAVLAVIWLKMLSKNRKEQAFIILWLLPFVTITLLFYFSNKDFLTEYIRFLPEVEMGVALLVGYWVAQKVSSIKYQVFSIQSLWSAVVLGTILITGVYSLYKTPARWQIFKTNPNIKNSVEYQIASWLKENANGERVFLSGSTAFWLNEFAPDVWQVRGDIDQASTNRFWDRANYQIRNSPDPAETLSWLAALRVNYVVVHDNNSREYYHDFKFPEKFENIGQKVFDNGQGDRIYQLDAKLASVVSQKHLNEFSKETDKNEKAMLAEYAKWLKSGNLANLEKTRDGIKIKADVKDGDVIALGITHDKGWKARSLQGDSVLAIKKDPFGNLVILPNTSGSQEIYLSWKEGPDLWFGILISIVSFFFTIIILPRNFSKILQAVNKGWQENE